MFNRTLVCGTLYSIPNTWERKFKADSHTVAIEYSDKNVVHLKENNNTYLLQTDIVQDNSYLEYYIYLSNDCNKAVREILREEDLKLKDKQFYFDCRIETYRNPPYLSFRNANLVDPEVVHSSSFSLYTSTINCEVIKHNLSGEEDIYNFMLVKTINDENYNNPLKIQYLDPSASKLEGKQKINVRVEGNKLIMV